ncbi:hypothetical protein AVEN_253950-1 [Araneus ventricosus]|uniref:Histone-lysine N-methyltransferase SETMAR n=1 Tax=Araneus ventricosus TaxID=182803 RepID=A0A4Y2NF26_ARAVE|nr:hypothetical protein AVEN_253950-1 [Araneus ventricosus]
MSFIQRKRPGLLSRGILFLDDNARSSTARDAKEDIRRLGWERWDDPAYCPDLAPSEFELFPPSKYYLLGRHFRNNEEVQRAVTNTFPYLGTDFYQHCFLKFFHGELKGTMEKTPTRIIEPPTTIINEAILLHYHPSNEGKRLNPAVLGVKAKPVDYPEPPG